MIVIAQGIAGQLAPVGVATVRIIARDVICRQHDHAASPLQQAVRPSPQRQVLLQPALHAAGQPLSDPPDQSLVTGRLLSGGHAESRKAEPFCLLP